MPLYDAKTSFASGELSPELWGRVDLAQYQTGARTIKNFIVLPQGGLINRPGTSLFKTPDGAHFISYPELRLVPFVFSGEDSSVLAFGDGTVRRYNREGQQEAIGGSPYRAAHLPKLRWLQSADVLYLFHPDVPVHALSRTAGGWKFERVTFRNGPFEDMNTDPDRTLRFTEATGYIRMRANFDMADMLFEGQVFRVEVEIPAKAEELSIPRRSADEFGEWVEMRDVFGAFTYRTSGKWTGVVEVQRCRPDGWNEKDSEDDWEWETFKTYTSEAGAEENFNYSGTVEEYANHYRFRYKGNKAELTVNFNYEGGLINRVLRVTSVVNSRLANVEDVDGRRGNIPPTDAWAEGSFGPKYGYPSMGIFHQERLILANTRHSPQTLWMSQPASWHNFGLSIPAKDDDSITLTLASKEVNEIRGLASRGDLLVFTAGGEWTVRAGSKSDVFTPGSTVVTPSGYRGSADIAPLDVGDVTLFVQRQGTTVRSIGYSLEVDGYASSDISILAGHLFEGNPVVAWAYQQTPWSVVWCALADGTMAALTLQREHQVNAWTRQELGSGAVVDVCCVPGEGQDDVFFAVRWSEDYHSPYRVELLNRRENLMEAATFQDGGSKAVHSVLECLDWERAIGNGTLQGRLKQIPALTLRLLNTKGLFGGVVTENSARLDALQFPLQDSPGVYRDGLYTGDVRLLPPGGTGRTCRVRLEKTNPAPVTILGIFPEIVVPKEGMVSDEN